jgi:hypothetical protein
MGFLNIRKYISLATDELKMTQLIHSDKVRWHFVLYSLFIQILNFPDYFQPPQGGFFCE